MISKKKKAELERKAEHDRARWLKERKHFATLHGLKMNARGEYRVEKTVDTFHEYKPSAVYRRETGFVPSLDSKNHYTGKPEALKYTGTLIKGIATMHKSNAVPVISQEHAEAISKMRRN